MNRATGIASAVAVVATATALWMWRDNMALRAAQHLLASAPASTRVVLTAPPTSAASTARDPWATRATQVATTKPTIAAEPPRLPDNGQRDETPLERRARRMDETAAIFGRIDDESDDEYRARLQALVGAAMFGPRKDAAVLRTAAEAKAGVTDAQHAQLDAVMEETYAAALDYTNAAITDGKLSPYRRNAAGLAEIVGGLGGLLGETEGKFGSILTPAQQATLVGAGFDWGEYLGSSAPWEQLSALPPPP